MDKIISYRKYTYLFSAALLLAAVTALFLWQLKPAIDFTGGTLIEVGCPATAQVENCVVPETDEAVQKLSKLGLHGLTVQRAYREETPSLIISYIQSDERQNEKVVSVLRELSPNLVQLRTDFIGASVSEQLKKNTLNAIVAAVAAITLYIAWAFRKVSYFVPSWVYGVGAIVALIHDILIVTGVFSFLGEFAGVEVGVPFVAALLTILGYSVNDTIVVYDRIRENILRLGRKKKFEELVNRSIRETLARSLNTSITVVTVLVAVMIFGGESLYYFALALLIGVVAGTYSSVFVATALIVTSYNRLKHLKSSEAV